MSTTMHGDCEAGTTGQRDFKCVVRFQRKETSFAETIDVNAQIKDITGVILRNINVSEEARGAPSNIWKFFLVNGNERSLLGNDLVLSECDLTCLESNGRLELVDDVLPAPQGGAGVVLENIWPLPVIVTNRNGQVVAKFTKDCNVTLPGQSIIDCILQDENIPQEVRTSVEPWRLFLVHEELGMEEAVPEKCTLRSIADNNVLADHVHLKVAIID